MFAFSRFARSTTHLLAALQEFKENGIQFISITEKIDTSSPMGMAMFTILGALSQMERELIAQRVRAGLANARALGKHIGRKKTRPSELIRALLKKKMKYREIASICNCSHGSINAERKMMLAEEEKKKAENQKPVFSGQVQKQDVEQLHSVEEKKSSDSSGPPTLSMF